MYVHDEILFYMVQRKINLKQKLQIKYFFFLPARDQNSSMVQKFLKAGITDICRKSKHRKSIRFQTWGERSTSLMLYCHDLSQKHDASKTCLFDHQVRQDLLPRILKY